MSTYSTLGKSHPRSKGHHRDGRLSRLSYSTSQPSTSTSHTEPSDRRNSGKLSTGATRSLVAVSSLKTANKACTVGLGFLRRGSISDIRLNPFGDIHSYSTTKSNTPRAPHPTIAVLRKQFPSVDQIRIGVEHDRSRLRLRQLRPRRQSISRERFSRKLHPKDLRSPPNQSPHHLLGSIVVSSGMQRI